MAKHGPKLLTDLIPAIFGLATGFVAVAQPLAAAETALLSPVSIAIQASGTELDALKELVAEVSATLASPQFRSNLLLLGKTYPAIYVGPNYLEAGQAATLATPEGLLRLFSPAAAPYRAHPLTLTLTGTYYNQGELYTGTCKAPSGLTIDCSAVGIRQNGSNMLAATHGIGLNHDGAEIASIEIGRQIFNRYKSNKIETRSCMINTLAHEWTHGFGKQSNHWAVVEDSINGQLPQAASTYPVASYFLGTVAQCTWLQKKGIVPNTQVGLKACAAQYGVSDFKSLQCT